LGAVVDQEAGHAGELVRLERHDLDGEFLTGQVRARKLQPLDGLSVGVDRAALLVVAPALERLDAAIAAAGVAGGAS
jgi:hypothetical protein